MRLRLVAAAAVAFAPVAVQAQPPGTVVRTYDLAGCGEGLVPGVPGLQPNAVCATGHAVLFLADGTAGAYRFQLFLAFQPDARQTSPSYTVDGATFLVRYPFTRCGVGNCVRTEVLTPENAPVPRAPQQVAFTSPLSPPGPLIIGLPEPLEARVNVRYVVPEDPFGPTGANVIVRFTATPEPSTVLLVAAGGFVLAGAARRRRA